MAGVTESEKKEKGFVGHFFFWVAVGFAFVAVYVLSAGPVTKYAVAPGGRPGPVILGIYAPLIWVCGKSRLAERAMDWYVERVWGVSDR
jgi:hypothetical protein